jgi:hypothetical protein
MLPTSSLNLAHAAPILCQGEHAESSVPYRRPVHLGVLRTACLAQARRQRCSGRRQATISLERSGVQEHPSDGCCNRAGAGNFELHVLHASRAVLLQQARKQGASPENVCRHDTLAALSKSVLGATTRQATLRETSSCALSTGAPGSSIEGHFSGRLARVGYRSPNPFRCFSTIR